jgi:predicted permease
MDTLTRDLRYAARSLRRSPLFVAVAAITLAFGIGVNATIFTFVNALLLRPLPVERPEELVSVFTSWPEERYATSSYPDYLDLSAQNDAFAGLFGHSMAIASLQREGQSEMVIGELVTGTYFEVLGVDAERGRTLLAADDADVGAPRVVVLGHGLWQRRFGGDPGVVGRAVRLSGESYEVVGVAPADFPGLTPGLAADFWAPAVRAGDLEPAGQINAVHGDPGRTSLDRRGYRWLWIKARLRPGVDPAAAEAQVATVMSRLAAEHPVTNRERGAVVLPAADVRFHPDVDAVLGPAAAVLLGVVGLVLLIVCANLANMLLSRAQGRRREIAIRLALGAGRGRLVRQLLAEGFLLSTLGGVLALAMAWWTTRLLLVYQPPIPFSLSLDMGVDARVAVFTALLALCSTLVFGLVPALQASRPELVPALKEGSGVSPGASRFFNLKNALVMVQVAVSLVLLIAAALLGRGLAAARSIDVGFAPERVAAVLINLEMHGYDRDQAGVFFRTLRERVAAMPGVESAAVARRVPFDLNLHNQAIYPETLDLGAEDPGFATDVTWVDPEYFDTVGVSLLRGRPFITSDVVGTPRVAVVNAAMARRHWGGVDVIGQRFRVGGIDAEPYEIVGVAADHKVRTVGEEPRPFVHFARAQTPVAHGYLLARSATGDAGWLTAELRRAALEMDPNLAFAETTTLAGLMAVSLYPVRMGATLLGVFGVLALVLASVGLYGVIAYSVGRRDREIGLRIAMGARPRDVVGLVLRGGMAVVAAGMVAGLALAAGLSRFLSGVLYGTSAVDPLAFGAAALALLAVALLANYLPAARASRLDPLVALRQE